MMNQVYNNLFTCVFSGNLCDSDFLCELNSSYHKQGISHEENQGICVKTILVGFILLKLKNQPIENTKKRKLEMNDYRFFSVDCMCTEFLLGSSGFVRSAYGGGGCVLQLFFLLLGNAQLQFCQFSLSCQSIHLQTQFLCAFFSCAQFQQRIIIKKLPLKKKL